MTRNMTQKNKALKTQGFTHRGWENRTPTKGFGDPYHTIWPIPYARYTFKTAYTLHLSFHFCEHNHSGQALDRLVTVSSMPYGTSTPALSTSSSSRGLTSLRMGYLILRGASRLDAFSVYPFPTWLPGREPGGSTGTPEVSPSRSSRTKDSSSQISYAHAG